MSNTLTGLIDYIYESADVVSRELVGLIPSVYLNGAAEQVGLNQDVTYDVVPTMSAETFTPAAVPPALADTAYGTGTMAITKSRAVRFHWTGEDEAKLGAKKSAIENNVFAQAFRTLTNEIETDLAALYVNASRAFGVPGSTPFATAGDFEDAAEVVRILKDNGAPTSDLQLVVNTAAGAKLIGKQSRADIVGQGNIGSIQQQGILLAIAGCKIRESAAIKAHTAGTGANYLVNDADDMAIGDATVGADTGAGTILAGDVIEFGGDTARKYVVKTALNAGSLVLQAPGVRQVIANNDTITVGSSYAANMAFDRSAIHLLARIPKMPAGGDSAADEFIMVDPVSGLPFRVALYKGYGANQISISVCWGVKAVKPEHMALLLG